MHCCSLKSYSLQFSKEICFSTEKPACLFTKHLAKVKIIESAKVKILEEHFRGMVEIRSAVVSVCLEKISPVLQEDLSTYSVTNYEPNPGFNFALLVRMLQHQVTGQTMMTGALNAYFQHYKSCRIFFLPIS